MVSKAIELLQAAKRSGVQVSVSNGDLQVRLSKGADIEPGLLQSLKENKGLILDFLNDNKWKSEKVTDSEINIKPFNRTVIKRVPLSFSQERLWFINEMEGSVQYHLPTVLRLKGRLDKDALAFALKNIVERHEALRTVFGEEDGQVYQFVKGAEDWQLQLVEGSVYNENEKGLQDYIESSVKSPFDLKSDYMLRAALVSLSEDNHLLVVTMHHIASDAWSMSVIIKEIAESYISFLEGRLPRLLPLPIQFADYAFWQRNHLKGEVLEKKVNYWKEKLQDVSQLSLPADFSRPPVWQNAGATEGFSIDKELSLQLQQLARREGVTLFMTLLSAFKVLLQKYSRQTDICIGTSIAGRDLTELENLVGFFVNMLALRTTVTNDLPFTELLQQVKVTTTEAFQQQEVPFEKVVDIVGHERDLSRNPLFQVLFVLENTPEAPTLRLGELNLKGENINHATSKFDITFFVTETANGLQGAVQYSTSLYRPETILGMITHFKALLKSIIENPQQKVGLLKLLTPADEHQILTDFNTTWSDYPKDKSITAIFEEQVLKTPDNIAVAFEDEKLSYEQLNIRANQLGNYLIRKGITEETLVPVCLNRSVELIVAILGILKAGAAYVTIDPKYPLERINFMLHDIAAAVVISSKESRLKLPVSEEREVIEIDTQWPYIQRESKNDLVKTLRPANLAYVIYTSGSTGLPKGVLIEHGNVVSLVKGVNYISLSDKDILLSTGSPLLMPPHLNIGACC